MSGTVVPVVVLILTASVSLVMDLVLKVSFVHLKILSPDHCPAVGTARSRCSAGSYHYYDYYYYH